MFSKKNSVNKCES